MKQKIGERIKSLRNEKKLTQSELAELIGCSQAEISRMENDATPITVHDLYKLAQSLGVTVSELLGENPKIA